MGDGDKPPEYRVGYKHPPIETRWKKGQSGNSSGRRNKDPSLASTVMDALSERVTVVGKDGKRRRRTKLGVTVAQLANKAAAGDFRSACKIIDLARVYQPQVAPEPLRVIIEGGLPDSDQNEYSDPSDDPQETS